MPAERRRATPRRLSPLRRSPWGAALTAAVLTGGVAVGYAPPGPAEPDQSAPTGHADQPPEADDHAAPTKRRAAPAAGWSDSRGPEVPTPGPDRSPPGLGPETASALPADSRQALVVTGEGRNSDRSTAVLYRRTGHGWRAEARWAAHNARKGWAEDHRLGDLRSPVGVFGLTDAGGRLPNPGSGLPYHRADAFTATGTGFRGEPLAGSFDYVVAVNYNRVPGRTPLDWARPQGAERGGGVWVHVDHGGPTHGCVSLARRHMRALLRDLDPGLRPVIVMGDAAALAR